MKTFTTKQVFDLLTKQSFAFWYSQGNFGAWINGDTTIAEAQLLKDLDDMLTLRQIIEQAREPKIISQQFYNASQSWNFEKITKVKDKKFRVMIRRNAYDDQSYVRGYVFGNDKWNLIVDRPITTAACKEAMYVRNDESIKSFETDAASVLNELMEICT